MALSQPSPLPRGAVNVSQSHIAVARVLGTFSHTTCYPISFVLWTCFLDRSARGTAQAVEGAQRRGCCTKSFASCSSPHSPQQNHPPHRPCKPEQRPCEVEEKVPPTSNPRVRRKYIAPLTFHGMVPSYPSSSVDCASCPSSRSPVHHRAFARR